jgi:hypothetical protein
VTLPRLLLVVLVLTALAALVAGVVGVVGAVDGRSPVTRTTERAAVREPGARVPAGRPSTRGRHAAALAVLRAWDGRRAAAWAEGDEAALAALYTDGSAAGGRDRSMLRRYVARGLRVRGLRMQVLAGSVRSRAAGRIVIVVTDRLAHAVAVGRGVRVELPRDRASRRTVVLRRLAGEWRVARVRAQPSPAASTDLTLRSRKP